MIHWAEYVLWNHEYSIPYLLRRSQISEGALKRQNYLDNSYRKSAEIRDLRNQIGENFTSLAADPACESSLLEQEATKSRLVDGLLSAHMAVLLSDWPFGIWYISTNVSYNNFQQKITLI